MKLRRLLILASIAVAIPSVFWYRPTDQRSAEAVSVRFVCPTNDPGLGPSALLLVSNQGVGLIFCGEMPPQVHESCGWVNVDGNDRSGLGWLEPGESFLFTVPVPAGTGPWRVPVWWRREDLSQFEQFMNFQHSRLRVFLAQPAGHRDPWLPRARVSYSPEIGR